MVSGATRHTSLVGDIARSTWRFTKVTVAILLGLSRAAMAGHDSESQQGYTNNGNPNAYAACFDAAGHIYYPTSDSDCGARFPTAGNAYGFVPSATHHRSAR
jgi:hypothetical protein